MQQYTEMNPPMKIKAAGDNTLYGIAQGILLALVRDTNDVCRKAKLPVVLVPGLRRNICLQPKMMLRLSSVRVSRILILACFLFS